MVALLCGGGQRICLFLMRRVGQMVAKARAMANEFRSSFDEMARQSELGRPAQGGRGRCGRGQGADVSSGRLTADAAFKDINAGLTGPGAPRRPCRRPRRRGADHDARAADEWPDVGAPRRAERRTRS